jgi:hypothetical protein
MTPAKWVYKLTRWMLGSIFIYAGCLKLAAPENLTVLIEAYGLLPESLLLPAAIGLSLIELAAGIGLVFDIEGSLALTSVILGMFIILLVYGIWLGLDIDCGCFGPGDPEAQAFHGLKPALLRDVVMAGAVMGLYLHRRHPDIEPSRTIAFIKCLFKRNGDKAYG